MAKILVVDDEPHIRRLASFILQRAGHMVVAAANGQEALECVVADRPDLVVCDIGMPGLDGFQTLDRLRALEGCADLPVVMLTARGQARDELRARDAGASGYVTKPFGSAQLVAEVDRLLGGEDEPRGVGGLPA